MKKRKTIKVTQEDIDTATPCDSNLCPIAKATRRAFHRPAKYMAGEAIQVWYGSFAKGGYKYYTVPSKCSLFAQDFDAGRQVKPFSFTVEV